ncbi:unnamed protein product, partial [Rotaria magnacalcarata]
EISKLSIINNSNLVVYNHQITSKYILDMSYAIYDYIQSFCFPQLQQFNEQTFAYRSTTMIPNQLEQLIFDIRQFFSQHRLIYFTDSSSID